jgi:integrase
MRSVVCASPLEKHRYRAAGLSDQWVFPAPTRSGHIEQSSLKKRHKEACTAAGVEYFVPYTLRHTCLARWASAIDPYTLAYLAGYSSFAPTRRYVHPPQLEVVRAQVDKARAAQGGHKIGHSGRMKLGSEVA